MSATSQSYIPMPESPARRERVDIDVPVIGLIGAIGGGKSRVAAILAGLGAAVIDADAVGHRILDEPAIRDRVIARFGSSVRLPAGDDDADRAVAEGRGIDRKALATIVFAEPAALRDLESILHPPMREEIERTIRRLASRGEARAIVLDAAILLEAGWQDLCDLAVFVDAPLASRRDRVARQRGWTAEALSERERAQWPLDRKRNCADIVIANDSDLDDLEREVDRIWPTLSRRESAGRPEPEAALAP